MSKKALSKILVDKQLLSFENLEKAQKEQDSTGESLSSILIRMGALDKQTMRDQLAQVYGFSPIDLNSFEIDPKALKTMTIAQCKKRGVIPISLSGSNLVVAFSDPSNILVRDEVAFITHCRVQPVVALESEIKQAIESRYQSLDEQAGDLISEMELDQEDLNEDESHNDVVLEERDSKDPVIRFVNTMLIEAIQTGTSDIHVEPYEKYLRVRFRKDGILVEKYRPPNQMAAAIISRLKVMAHLNITEKRRPQDGRIKIRIPEKGAVDFRVSVIPTIFGEKVVIRILDKSNLRLDLKDLGFAQDELDKFLKAIHSPQGLVLVTGPTGSGKTTTLYSALNELHDVSKNISTAEDPVEFNIDGINQVQIRSDIQFNFAEALRSFLRQDPDIILIGEIRDEETAEVAFQAASTGHMVLSTLHTNDATKTVDRLLNMGVPGFLVTSTVELILAQRLLKKICPHCKVEDRVTPEVLEGLGVSPEELYDFKCYRGQGCDRCQNTGKSGRVSIYEVMPMTDALRVAILSGASPVEIRKSAIQGGLITLRQSGVRKIREGLVSVQEVLVETMKDPS